MRLDITTIYDLDDSRLNAYRHLRGVNQDMSFFIAEGKEAIATLLDSNRFTLRSLLIVAARLLEMMPLLEKRGDSLSYLLCYPKND